MGYSADEIGNRTFAIARRGYDRGEVEAFLRELARQQRSGAPAGPADGQTAADREEILEHARQEAQAIRADADEYASGVRANVVASSAPAAAPMSVAAMAAPVVPQGVSPNADHAALADIADSLTAERAALAEEREALAMERQAFATIQQRQMAAADRFEIVAGRLEAVSVDREDHPSNSATMPTVPAPVGAPPAPRVASTPPPPVAPVAAVEPPAPGAPAAAEPSTASGMAAPVVPNPPQSSMVRSSVRDTPPVVHRAASGSSGSGMQAPVVDPAGYAPATPLAGLPGDAEAGEASEALGRVSNLLDGVLDDVMGKVRPES